MILNGTAIDTKDFLPTILEKKKGFRYKQRKPFLKMVGRAGLEPAANGLKVHCSTTELTARLIRILKA